MYSEISRCHFFIHCYIIYTLYYIMSVKRSYGWGLYRENFIFLGFKTKIQQKIKWI